MENIENDKPLTALQKAQRNYYLKMKNDPEFIKKRNETIKKRRLTDLEFVEKQKLASLKNYYKIKDDPEYKRKVSLYKKQQWIKKKENNLLL
jgi:hypothetical protein